MVFVMIMKIRIANIIRRYLLETFCPIDTPRGAANKSPATNGKNKVGSK